MKTAKLPSSITDAEEGHRQRALLLRGVLDVKEAERLRAAVAAVRESWR